MNSRTTSKPKILIIGAGLGGLALAQGLTKAGFAPTIFERDQHSNSRAQGYRISLRSLGLNALSSLLSKDRMNRLLAAKVADVGDGFTFANEKMNVLIKIASGQDAAVQFLRSELRKLLQEDINVEWNKHFLRFEEKENQVIAHFTDGSQAQGDFLIGCDGAGSTIRGLLPSIYKEKLKAIPEVIYSSRVAIGGQLNRTPEWNKLLPLNQSGPVLFLGPHALALFVSLSERADRSPTIFWTITAEIIDRHASWFQFDQERASHQRLLEHCIQLIDEKWHSDLQKLIRATPSEGMMAPWFLRTTRFPDSMRFPVVPSGRVTLLGDSAHAMLPDRGLGGNNVLEDARLLSALLTSSSSPIDWPQLTGEFENQMFARAQKAVRESEHAAKTDPMLREQKFESAPTP